MSIRSSIRFFAIAGALVLGVLGVSGVAKAECQTFPKVPWWSKLSHRSVVHYVGERYDGDWASYTSKWERQLVLLEDIATRGKAAIVGKNRARLRDGALKDYIGQVEKRLRVIRCLSHSQEAQAASEAAAFDGFETAAGSDNPVVAVNSQVAGSFPGHLKMEVRADCQGGVARFQVVNMGVPWPQPGVISIHEVGNARPLSQGRMRLASGQSISFTIDTQKNGAAPLGLRVDPSWYARDVRYDATLTCMDENSRLKFSGNPSRS